MFYLVRVLFDRDGVHKRASTSCRMLFSFISFKRKCTYYSRHSGHAIELCCFINNMLLLLNVLVLLWRKDLKGKKTYLAPLLPSPFSTLNKIIMSFFARESSVHKRITCFFNIYCVYQIRMIWSITWVLLLFSVGDIANAIVLVKRKKNS